VLANPKSVLSALVDIKAEEAQAVDPADRDAIFAVISSTIGFTEVNRRVKTYLRAWYIATLRQVANEERLDSAEGAVLVSHIAIVFHLLGS
jgi:hypothetical protein